MTTVISVRGRDRLGLLADPDFVYIGRGVPRAGWKASPFGNPFGRCMPSADPAFLVGLFSGWLTEVPLALAFLATAPKRSGVTEEKAARWRLEVLGGIPALRGKKLGCWCCDWSPGEPIVAPCHGVVLAELANALGSSPKARLVVMPAQPEAR